MPIDLTSIQIQQLIIALSALSMMAAVLTVAWPWITQDRFAERVRSVEQDLRQSPRAR